MTDDQRALLDECTNRRTCTAAKHVNGCLSTPQLRLLGALQRSVDAARAQRREEAEASGERHAWVRRVPGSDVAIEKRGFVTDGSGQVLVDEAFLGQLLLDAGWERTA